MVQAAGLNPLHMEVYSIDSVLGIRAGSDQREAYSPFVDFSHAPQARAFYRVRRAPSPINDGLDTFLALGTARDLPPRLEEETISMRLTCTNRSLPGQLTIGDVSQPTATSPTLARFTNVLPVTKPVRPPLDSELHWRLLSHLSLGHRSLASASALQSLLSLYNFQTQGDQPKARANRMRAEAIRAVNGTPARRFIESAPVRGQRTTIELDESGFAGLGEMFLFGCVLDELLAAHLTLNSFHELSIQSFPSKAEYAWTPRSGSQPLM
jgi:type VI secretion system protein ImpG